MSDVLRIGNCSGFYGDRLSAMREMLDGTSGGHSVDVITGDYLAELTMLILGKDQLRDADAGYARTFLRQAEECLADALERGVRIVTNAGGLNPAGLAAKLQEVATGLGLSPTIAHLEGDNLAAALKAGEVTIYDADGAPRDAAQALTANAYLGAFGIAEALRAGADVVVTGRVTDASVVVGPAIAHFDWARTDYDRLAGAVVAGHVIECGCQATGGNFSGFGDLPPDALTQPLGFPIAELRADGSSVITKHDGTGGAVTTDTVTAQLVYEIQTNHYLGPDVTAHLDSIRLAHDGTDRVLISGVAGSPPPERLKVALNEFGGWRNSVEFVLTGLDIDHKAAWVRAQLETTLERVGAPATLDWSDTGPATADAPTEESASVLLRATALDADAEKVGRTFTSAAVELALASYPGFALTAPPAKPTAYGVYRPAYVDRAAVTETLVIAGTQDRRVVDGLAEIGTPENDRAARRPSPYPAPVDTLTRRMPLGTFVHARSGDKGGDANVGLWVATTGQRHDPQRHEARVTWLIKLCNPDRIREFVPEAADLEVEVYPLPNLGGVNVLIRGLLGEGVAASTRFDPQAKGLGEWIRSRMVSMEDALI